MVTIYTLKLVHIFTRIKSLLNNHYFWHIKGVSSKDLLKLNMVNILKSF